MKAMRGRIALKSTSCELYALGRSILRKLWERARPRVALESIVCLPTDPIQITFGGSRDGCFCVRKNIRLPPAAINLLQ